VSAALSDQLTTINRETIMFRKFLIVMLSLAFLGGFGIAEADGNKGKLVLLVDTHGFADFDTGASGGPGTGFPFYVTGDICEETTLTGTSTTCTPIGKFRCWGWDDGTGFAVVAQEYDLFGKGKIQVQGVEDEGPRAVTGGTGKYSNVRGEATGFDLSEFFVTGRFTGTFKLIGG
jgi:hypothetical protein